jgi:hypothetical protein
MMSAVTKRQFRFWREGVRGGTPARKPGPWKAPLTGPDLLRLKGELVNASTNSIRVDAFAVTIGTAAKP